MIKAGMDDAISKPFGIADLVARLRKLVERFGAAGACRKPDDSSGAKNTDNAPPTTPPPLPPLSQAASLDPPISTSGIITSRNHPLYSNRETPPIIPKGPIPIPVEPGTISPSNSPMTPLPAPLSLKIDPTDTPMGRLPSPLESPTKSETFALQE